MKKAAFLIAVMGMVFSMNAFAADNSQNCPSGQKWDKKTSACAPTSGQSGSMSTGASQSNTGGTTGGTASSGAM
ncbi:MAG TPA: hypothetical protein VL688_01105 [Verrucomicrobiae bacterium]|nr:hypothetical protein [Verrucomicrobiae bacterium]